MNTLGVRPVGIIGRFVEMKIKRGEAETVEAVEVMACEINSSGYWWILVATNDGTLLASSADRMKLAPQPAGEGPYR